MADNGHISLESVGTQNPYTTRYDPIKLQELVNRLVEYCLRYTRDILCIVRFCSDGGPPGLAAGRERPGRGVRDGVAEGVRGWRPEMGAR